MTWLDRGGPAPASIVVVVAVAAAAAVPGCATAPSKPVAEFPSQASLAALENKPGAAPAKITVGDIPGGGWQIARQDVASRPDEPWQPRGAWETALANAAAAGVGPRPRLTRALACAAREVTRFHLATGMLPPQSLQEFQFGACGAAVPHLGFFSVTGDVPAAVSDDQLLAQWGADLRGKLLDKLPADATEAGFWFGRANGKAAAGMAFAAPRARLTAVALAPDAHGDLLLEGELLEGVDHVVGYANRGRFAVEPCAIDPSVARPRFRAVCHIADADATAWVQLLAAPPKRVLSSPFVQLLIRRPGDAPLVYEDGPSAGSRPVSDAAGFGAALIEQLNVVRGQAGLGPVRASAAQSASAARLAPHYFADADPSALAEERDRIALGMLAGWQVAGMIRDGLFLSSLAPHTRDAGRWLASALITPLGRSTLLAPEIEEVAVGPLLLGDPDGLGAVVAGYRFHHGNDHSNDIRLLYARLLAARKRLALKLPGRLEGMDKVLRDRLALVHAGRAAPGDVLRDALAECSQNFGVSVRGYVIETTSLDALEIPEEIVKQPTLHMEIGVSHHKPPGAAWAQFVILVVFVDYGGSDGQRT